MKVLLELLADNIWGDPDDVVICVDLGDGVAYDLSAVMDHGNIITLVGDKE